MNYKDYLPRIMRNNRDQMRDCARRYRNARARGDVGMMIRWLNHAIEFRTLNLGYQEFA